MGYGNGTGASFGIASESTFNTYVAPDHFSEFNTESLNFRPNRLQGMGLRAGGVFGRKQRRVTATSDAGGDVTLDLTSTMAGLLLAHCTGTFPTKAAGAFVFTPGDLAGHSFTCQVGVPLLSGTVDPKTLTGCKVTDWELAVPNAGFVTLKATIDAAGFTRSTALATPSYTAATAPFHFAQATLKIGGSTVAYVQDVTLSFANALKTDRQNVGGAGVKAEQVHNGFRALTGTMNAEFVSTTAYAAFLADTDSSLQLTLTSGSDSLDVLIPCIRFDGDAPQVGGPEVVMQSLPFTALDNGTNAVYTITYTTTDAAL